MRLKVAGGINLESRFSLSDSIVTTTSFPHTCILYPLVLAHVPPYAPKTKLAFIELMQTSMSVDPGMLAAFAMLDEDAFNPFALHGAFALFAI